MFNWSSFEQWRQERDGSGGDGNGTSGRGGKISNAAIAEQIAIDHNGFEVVKGVYARPVPQVAVSNRGRGRPIPPNPYARKAAPKATVSMFFLTLFVKRQ